MKIESVNDIVDADLCAGCGICESISGRDQIEMNINHAGFYRPQVYQTDPEAWKIIRNVCPGVVVKQDNNSDARGVKKLWGPILSGRIGYSTDDVIRWQASSGGVQKFLRFSTSN